MDTFNIGNSHKDFYVLDWLYEYYLPVKGYEELYEVSNWGNVRSLDRFIETNRTKPYPIKGRQMKHILDKVGYERFELSDKFHNSKRYYGHILVSNAFKENPLNLPEVNHRDENKANNSVWNLEYCDRSYNINYGNWKAKQSNRPDIIERKRAITAYKQDGTKINFDSICSAGRELNIPLPSICRVLRGERKHTRGYMFEYS